eukprot:432504_1
MTTQNTTRQRYVTICDVDENDAKQPTVSLSHSFINNNKQKPSLFYQQFGGKIASKVINDSVLCLTCHSSFLILGMKSGMVYMTDITNGNIITQYKPHPKYAMSDISIDEGCSHIATCHKDGSVIIRNILKGGQTINNFKNECLLSVQINPNYVQNKIFVTGGRGGKLFLKKIALGIFNQTKILQSKNKALILNIKWAGTFIACAKDCGVEIYDINTNKTIGYLPNSTGSFCCLCFENTETLLIAWTNCIVIVKINSIEIQLTNRFKTGFRVCSIAPFNTNSLLLALDQEIRIVSRYGEHIASDFLQIQKQQTEEMNYRLGWLNNTYHSAVWKYCIVTKMNVMIAEKRTVADDIAWFRQNGEFEKAWGLSVSNKSKLSSTAAVTILANELLAYVLENEPDRFRILWHEICDKNQVLWKKWINILYEKGKLNLLIEQTKPLQFEGTLEIPSYDFFMKQINKINKDDVSICYIDSWKGWNCAKCSTENPLSNEYCINCIGKTLKEIQMKKVEVDEQKMHSISSFNSQIHRYEKLTNKLQAIGYSKSNSDSNVDSTDAKSFNTDKNDSKSTNISDEESTSTHESDYETTSDTESSNTHQSDSKSTNISDEESTSTHESDYETTSDTESSNTH